MVLLMLATTVNAEITNIVITNVTSPAFNGVSFGSVGQYEEVDGIAYGEVDPDDPHNEIIQDIKLAPRNARGKVEYHMDFNILRPIDLSKSNHTIIYDVVQDQFDEGLLLPADAVTILSQENARNIGIP